MGIHALGDSAWLFKAGGETAQQKLKLILRLIRLIERHPMPKITDIVSGMDSVAVHFDPIDGEEVFEHLTSLKFDDVDPESGPKNELISVPMAYGGEYGPDLDNLAHKCNLTPKEVVQLHSRAEYTVATIGFSPGFPYLAGLPQAIHQPRLATPRMVAAGSVGIAGGQTGIYPFDSQGGWNIIGRTDLQLFNPKREQPSLLKPGDRIRFESVDELSTPMALEVTEHKQHGDIRIIEAGALSSIQDLGRPGWQHIGVCHGGAADPISARVANRLVGNPDDAPLIECSMTGPKLQFEREITVAWVGWGSELSGRPITVKHGTRLDLSGKLHSLRGYIAVSGGIRVPRCLGSASTDLRAKMGGVGGRALRDGDLLLLEKAETKKISMDWHVNWPRPESYRLELRVTRGMQAHWFTKDARRKFISNMYELSPASDRTGCRLNGPTLELLKRREMTSEPVVSGSVQVPPDGSPIVLMNERQTIGGYPQIANIITADLFKLARAWPGSQIHFREVTLEEARHAAKQMRRDLGTLNAGLHTLL